MLFQATMCARPLIGVHTDGVPSGTNVTLPAVFRAPIRPDVVTFIHNQMAKNTRQAYCVNKDAGNLILNFILFKVRLRVYRTDYFYKMLLKFNI